HRSRCGGLQYRLQVCQHCLCRWYELVRGQHVHRTGTGLRQRASAADCVICAVFRDGRDHGGVPLRLGTLEQQLQQPVTLGLRQRENFGGESREHDRLDPQGEDMIDHAYEALLVHRAVGGERRQQHGADAMHRRTLDRPRHQNAALGTSCPRLPTRKSRSTPRSACSTCSTYSPVQPPRSQPPDFCSAGAAARRRSSSASSTSRSSRRSGTSRTTMSSSRTSASGPPAAPSGATCSTTVPNEVPLILASEIRTISLTPCSSSFTGSGRLPTSGIPG